MKNLLGKFHAELSQQRLASQAEPSQAKPSRAKPSQAEPSQAKPSQVCLFIFYYKSGPKCAAALIIHPVLNESQSNEPVHKLFDGGL